MTGWRRSRLMRRRIAAGGRRGFTGGTSSSSCPAGPVTVTRSPTPTWKPFDPHLLVSALKVANSAGLRTYYSATRRSQAEASLWASAITPAGSPPSGVDVSWPVDMLAPEVGPLAHRLADLGVPAPDGGPDRVRAQRPGVAGGDRLGRPAGRDHRGRGRGVRRSIRGGGVGRAAWRGTGRRRNWPRGSWEGTGNGPVAAARRRPTRRSTSWTGRSRAPCGTSCGSSARTRPAPACGSSSSRATHGCTRRGSPTTTGR